MEIVTSWSFLEIDVESYVIMILSKDHSSLHQRRYAMRTSMSNQLQFSTLGKCGFFIKLKNNIKSFFFSRSQKRKAKDCLACLIDLDIKLGSTPTLFKYADDSTIVAPAQKGGSDSLSGLVEKFLTWANCNSMSCNPNKCKEIQPFMIFYARYIVSILIFLFCCNFG